ncbi:MAG: hypothetical protein V4710_24830 [Verrucomicrobiota bacterium]
MLLVSTFTFFYRLMGASAGVKARVDAEGVSVVSALPHSGLGCQSFAAMASCQRRAGSTEKCELGHGAPGAVFGRVVDGMLVVPLDAGL